MNDETTNTTVVPEEVAEKPAKKPSGKEVADIVREQLAAAMETMRKELRAEIEAEVKAEIQASPAARESAAKAVKELTTSMKKKLAARPQVTIKIPIDKMNPKDLTVPVQINGYTYIIERGKEVTVPDVVKRLLERGGYI